MKDRSTLYLSCAALGTLALAAAPAPQAHDGDARIQAATTQQQFNSQRNRNELVKIVRQVTDKYHSIAVAEGDGYHLLFGCVSDEDSGAMGLHYVNLGLYAHQDGTFDDQIDPYQPEIILYEPTRRGVRSSPARTTSSMPRPGTRRTRRRPSWMARSSTFSMRRTASGCGRSTRCTSGRGRTARRVLS